MFFAYILYRFNAKSIEMQIQRHRYDVTVEDMGDTPSVIF